MLELVVRLSQALSDAAARLSGVDTDPFRRSCEAVITWIAQSVQSGHLTLLDAASHAANFQNVMNWMATQVAAGKLTLLEVARITADYIAYFS